MNPRTLCACQPVAFMIWASVAPPLRWSRPRTVAFLLPSRAAAGLLPALPRFPLADLAGLALAAVLAFLPCFAAALALLAHFGAAGAAVRFPAAVQALDCFPDPADRRLPIRK